MPTVEHPNGSFYIPFDPDIIAKYMYNGIKVFPDKGTPEKRVQLEQPLIQDSLRSLWQDQNVRTTPGRDRGQKSLNAPTISDRQGHNESPMDVPASNFRRVMPNPTINFQMRDIDPTPVTNALPKTNVTRAPTVNLNDVALARVAPDVVIQPKLPLRDIAAFLDESTT